MGTRIKLVGREGWVTLALSCCVMTLSVGITFAIILRRVHRTAQKAPSKVRGQRVLVLGRQLVKDQPTQLYLQRLHRAVTLVREGLVPRVVVLGGRTGGNSRTEADVGFEVLVANGVASDRIELESESRHTLENLRFARDSFSDAGTMVLISNRYHLARIQILARGLGMEVLPCAAESGRGRGLPYLFNIMREAFLIHWYYVGRTWSRWTGNRKALARIS